MAAPSRARLLKHHIPLKTDRWDVTVPGFTEIDLVAHSGDRADGEFLHSLNVTDIHTTWVETRAVHGQESGPGAGSARAAAPGVAVCAAGHRFGQRLGVHQRPSPAATAGPTQIQFTRGRPYKKDDNAHIEQKNWTHVRKLLGYVRYDSRGGADGDQRRVCGPAAAPESLSAVGQAAAQRARRRARAPPLRRAADAARPGARLSRRRCRQPSPPSIRLRDAPRSVRARRAHRRANSPAVYALGESSPRASALVGGGRRDTRKDRACLRGPATQNPRSLR